MVLDPGDASMPLPQVRHGVHISALTVVLNVSPVHAAQVRFVVLEPALATR
ncbi:MAG: hypothetical protein IPN77_14055 [Sandaracinaceae bacterium]|nr:hypothetical protein [Sandaracinaceae bacterium]